ncbi:hypothetical protein AYM40_17115 [Paraburkholderia phytofirmans OLGA172]|uniref:Uncharacterized protein n=1 Tax=Paraburkholderia phytofirmans OLGA172 TaxID=1417228 RepID=A0A167W3Y9_9BURK|nr:hypothetical protein [Paraburkholderia phytofirmans]ANB73893.1 hypothetical protein AYM40_17115 [Paraburkholderia phytofirmans OLGA172]
MSLLAVPDDLSNSAKTEINMPDSNGTARVSIPRGTSISMVTDEALIKHGFDLIHFPSYLARKVAPRVRVEISTECHDDHDLTGWYQDDQKTRSWKCAKLIADENGCVTDSDAFYHLAHAAFSANADALTYIGFVRSGRPPDAPLFALAMMYQKYGRGIYLAGELLPDLWPQSSSAWLFSLR